MEALFRLLPGPQPVGVRYAATTLLVLLAFAIRYGLDNLLGPHGFTLFILPVVASALLFDRGTGFFATALSAALVASILPWQVDPHVHVTAIITFFIVSSCLVFIAEGLHKALETAHNAQLAADLLLQEMSHRVKNKFAMISSIISLQAREASPDVRRALEDVASRVSVIATVHNYLQLSRHEGVIDMSEYVPSLCRCLGEALDGPRAIFLSASAVDARLPPEKALSAGVIVNELVTNAFKYAFEEGRPGRVRVELVREEAELVLAVSDDGKGCPEDTRGGLGKRLVAVFATQLGGAAHWETPAEGGCRAVVKFPA